MKIEINDMGINFEGVGKAEDGKIVFVPYAISGEVCEVEILKENKKFIQGQLDGIKTFSEKRIMASCPYFGECGGCDCQHIDYKETLKIKSSNLIKTLKHISGIDFENVNITGSDEEYNYRNKIVFSVCENKIGFKHKKSNKICEIKKCQIADEKINYFLKLIRENIDFKNTKISHILIRHLGGQTIIVFVTKKMQNKKFMNEFISKINLENTGIYFNINPKENEEILSNKFVYLCGIKSIKHQMCGIEFTILPGQFFQTNFDVAQRLYSRINELISDKYIIEGYSGGGLLSGILSKGCTTLESVELNEYAVQSARELLAQNAITNVVLHNGKFEIVLSKILSKNYSPQNTTILLDPPKAGLSGSVIKSILEFLPNSVIYVSCSMQSLCRDLSELKAKYDIENLEIFDMFPQTKNMEILAKLKLKKD